MKLVIKQIMHSMVMAGLIPALLISAISNNNSGSDLQPEIQREYTPNYDIRVLKADGDTANMDMETYLTGVLLGEVSADFYMEALKAQAVAARTYTLYCIDVLKKHDGGAVCTDYHCCQSYCEPEDYLANGGTSEGVDRVTDAVNSTEGQVLRYKSELICATYFASSGGKTEDAMEVWGTGYPYLKSVDSPGEEESGYYNVQVTFTPSQLQEALGVELTGSPKTWFGMVRYTEGCGVDLMRIGGKLYTGVELRSLLKLRSTYFSVTATESAIIFDTKGYGHRVGMSQHGANAMAGAGSKYHEILLHYYRGTKLHSLRN